MKKRLAVILFLAVLTSCTQGQNITGSITGVNSQPVPGAVIRLLNTQKITLASENGSYIIKDVPKGKYILEVTAIGYATINEEVLVNEEEITLNIRLINSLLHLDEVVVTATKKEESLQDVPFSVTAISAKQVQEYRLWDSKELTAIVPNLYSNNSGDDRNVTSIRGIVTTSYDPAVATYIDGVNQFSLDTYIGGLNDIERVEILRGPQGTLYGRNAMGGVINIITKQPTNATTGFVELNFGNYGMQRYTAAIRTPRVKNKLYFGASALFSSRDGFYTNTFNNTAFDDQNTLTGNYYLKYTPADNWALTLNVKHQGTKNDGAFPLVNGVADALAEPFKLSQDAVGKMIDNTLNASLNISHTGTALNFTSITAWQQNHRYYKAPLDGDFSSADAVTVINDYGNKWNRVKVFTQELRFNSTTGESSPFKWTAGTYFFYQENPTKQATHFGKDAALVGAPMANFSTINTTKGNNTGIAFYGQTNYSLTKDLDLIAGIRYDYENRKLQVGEEFQNDGEAAIITRPDTSATVHFSAFSPKLGLDYKIAPSSNLYVTYSRGYRTGGLTQLSPEPSQPPLFPYKPEYSNNYEAGIKNTFFNNRLRLNVAVFVTHVTDAQVPTLVLPEAITITKNTGKLTSKGAELELAASPLKGLQVDYNFGYTNAKYTSLRVSQNGQSVDLNGKKQIYTPDMTSMLAVQYSYALGKQQDAKLVARGEFQHIGTEYFDLANTIKQSPYSLFNLRAGISSKHADLFFWSRNTGNKKYIVYAYDFGAVHLGDPSTYGATLTFRL